MNRACSHLILGSGISGMTLALLFAATGAKVTVLEKSAVIGGAMQRFRRHGIPLDTGFHFTGGVDDCLGAMLRLLGIRDEVKATPIPMRFKFFDSGREYEMPRGHQNAERYLCEVFPADTSRIHAYFAKERDIFHLTPLFDLAGNGGLFAGTPDSDSDFITLSDYLDELGIQGELRAILSSSGTCYGTPPKEISLANHCRVNYGLLNDLVRFQGGGATVVDAFRHKAEALGIEVLTGTTIADLDVVETGGKIHTARLTDGSSIRFEHCLMTVHPREILRLLPPERIRPDFRTRIGEFQETCGFFTYYGRIADDAPGFREELCSCFSGDDLDAILTGGGDARATGLMCSQETGGDGRPCRCVTAFQSVFPTETAAWDDTVTGHRPSDYQAYKAEKCAAIEKLIGEAYPNFRECLTPLASASMLTYRDYLSPFGSAYGIRQKIGQHNIFGRLPVRNFYAAGQNSVLPGAMGAMLSCLILFRKLAGENVYRQLLNTTLGVPLP